jgi:arginase
VRLAVIGVPTNSSWTLDGVARGPAALRQAGLVERLRQHGDVDDYGDVVFSAPTTQRSASSGIIAEQALSSMVSGVRGAVIRALQDDRFPLVLGGDCPLLLGCLAAGRDRYGRLGLLFVDGHEDAYPPRESPTGEAADMELGLALGRVGSPLPADLAALLPLVAAEAVTLIGPRDADLLRPEGVASLAGEVEFYGDTALEGIPVDALTLSVLRRLGTMSKAVWLHIDLDVLSGDALPAVDYPQPGGLSWSQLEALTTTAMQTDTVIGCDITIYNPDLDPGGIYAQRITDYFARVMAQRAANRR